MGSPLFPAFRLVVEFGDPAKALLIQAPGRTANSAGSRRETCILCREHMLKQVGYLLLLYLLLHLQLHELEQLYQICQSHGWHCLSWNSWGGIKGGSSLGRHG